MRKRCLRNLPFNEPKIVIETWHLKACDGNSTAAQILGYFRLAEVKLMPRIQFFGAKEAQTMLLNAYHISTVKAALLHMVEIGLLKTLSVTRDQAAVFCCSKEPQRSIGHLLCGWCTCQTVILQEHHYPISQKEGGTKTVQICGSCHAEYHYLSETPFYLPTPKLQELISNNPLELDSWFDRCETDEVTR